VQDTLGCQLHHTSVATAATISVTPNGTIHERFVMLQVVEDFAADNVVYLELRTTPKVLLLGVEMMSVKPGGVIQVA
jgi:hypothetical protein